MEIDSYKKYEKTFKSDMYIMIPYTSYMKKEAIELETDKDDISTKFLTYMKEYSNNYCNNEVTKGLERIFIEKNKIACFDYNYNEQEVDREDVYMFLTKHKSTGLYILIIADYDNKYSTTQIEDQITTNKIYVYENDKKINIDDYIKNNFNLIRCGEAKTLLSISNKPQDELEFKCMLACETYKEETNCEGYYKLTSKEMEEISKNNFSQYDFYEIYASKSVVIYILKTFKENVLLNIEDEVPILFIMELIMFQNASVLRTNKRIIDKLSKNGITQLKSIENLYKEFGKTIKFWNKDVFKYITVQNISYKINQAFETDKTLQEYYKNQNFLEHIVNLRDIQDSNRESKILNIIVLILTLIQVVPICIEFINWFYNIGIKKHFFNYIYMINLPLLIIILILIIVKRRKDKKKHNTEL